jgi:hypothetical protein
VKRPALVSLVIALLTVAAPGGGGPAQAAELRLGTWTVGAGLGFLRDTPDDTAFALNLNADYVMDPRFSIGPLLQLGFTGDMSQIGLSGQAKYWLPLPDTGQRFKLAIQGGLGFIYSSFRDDDTSWLIPLGVGVDYAIDDKLSATGTFILNLTDLDTGRGSDANVMPGVTFGVRF